MNARNVNAPRLQWLVVRLLPAMLLLLMACSRKKKPPPLVVPPPVSTATTEGAALVADAAVATPVASVAAAPVDPLSPPDRAAVDQTQAAIRDLDWMVKHAQLTNPAKPGEGDASMKCASIEEARPRLEALGDPDVQKLVVESRRLCSLEVPILNCNHSLRQVSISPSQASRRLICGFASKDLEKARKEKPNDRRVRDLDMRFAQSCK